ncbi:Metallo-dependent phosphatase [Polyplosphaeria fusca]|uniref:Metallo-dependent phosphatase n=1 Tax=Polyplosphaeria fusca TaxID=682080 RepID=A0A9P4R8M7_9PLEO|nr:Metallo-dependent phosphatase [Polyplosphaeria fusca]
MESTATPQTRKTRIVCISDTHNQTPKLPKGDVLIHAGDLTNQGSFSELKKTVEWIEKAEFEAKIVVAGNHDITLDGPFYEANGTCWRWPRPQDPEACRALLLNSPSITYLEHEAASIYLNSPGGPRTCFNVFGSPYTPNKRQWAFKYGEDAASTLWDAIPHDTDIVVTHTPPKNHCDGALNDRCGCEGLLRALHCVRPLLSVCGHIHEARGAERLWWDLAPANQARLVEGVDMWKDPGVGNKQSLVDLSRKGGRPLSNGSALPRQTNMFSLAPMLEGRSGGQAVSLNSTSGLEGVSNSEARARAKAMSGGAIECRRGPSSSDIGSTLGPGDVGGTERASRKETCVINAAFKGPRTGGGPQPFNKVIVVDVDLPVWTVEQHAQ